MREISDIREIRSILLDLACEVKSICEENNLRYYLSGGTLLGAVRHKGFIPWDDDIDMHMPRPDYEKFIEIYNSKPRQNILYSQETHPQYLYSFAKLSKSNTLLIEKGCKSGVEMGIYLDIFPIDGMGNSVEQAKNLMKTIEMPINLLMSYRMDLYRKHVSIKKNFLVFTAKIVSSFIGFKKLSKKVNKLALTYDYDNSLYVGEFIDEVGEKRICKKDIYEGNKKLMFEGIEFSVPNNYHEYLTQFYGDYMQLPPIEKQVFVHDYKAYLKEE